MSKSSIGIISIATNHYIDYWHEQVKSIAKNCATHINDITIHIFTDQPNRANEISAELPKLKFVIHEIDSLGWPEATLYRFRLIEGARESLTQDLLVYLDADMLVLQDFISQIPSRLNSGIGLVIHPGYFRPKSLKLIAFYLRNPRQFLIDCRNRLLIGGIGSWEIDDKFKTNVPRKLRQNYVCGGTWLGSNKEFLRMISELSSIEQEETKKGLIPRWHDESILNWWCANNSPTLLSSSFCYEPSYPQLRHIPEFIRAVNKNG